MNRVLVLHAATAAGLFAMASTAVASPYASTWTSYNAGTNASIGFADPGFAVGSPTRMSAPLTDYKCVVSPFSAPFNPGEFTSIGRGGHLTLAFDHDVYNRPTNAYGFDFIVFGNWFYTANNSVTADGKYSIPNGIIEVSKDGLDWRTITGVSPTDGYATNGYADVSEPYQDRPGNVLSDFTKPVNPSFNPIGKSFTEIIAGYNGSGGGTGVDFASTGLDFIRYVRISNPEGNSGNINIDAIAEVVPAPAALPLLAFASLIAPRRRRA